jgi:hypothetical protein
MFDDETKMDEKELSGIIPARTPFISGNAACVQSIWPVSQFQDDLEIGSITFKNTHKVDMCCDLDDERYDTGCGKDSGAS